MVPAIFDIFTAIVMAGVMAMVLPQFFLVNNSSSSSFKYPQDGLFSGGSNVHIPYISRGEIFRLTFLFSFGKENKN